MKKIGRYEIRRELGRGGMATVYEAFDPLFKRDVAIKMLPQAFSHDPQFRARFEREAQTVAMLEHPAIVPVYDYGEENGRLYLVMRLMSGGSLADRLNRGPMSPQETSEIMARIASALDAAHARGIIHRDLKPANILFDRWDKPYLSDFGIVKVASESSAALTATGGLIGTPAYMSPEQVQGEENLDGRSDIYALGIILFESLTGQTPYNAPTPMGLAFKHVNEPTPRLGAINATIPSGFQRVIETAMAKNRADRYPTAQAMANGLTVALQTTPGDFDETVIENDPWQAAPGRLAAPDQLTAPEQFMAPEQPKRKIPALGWIVGGLLFAICGIISVAALFIFVSGDGLNGGLPVAENTAVVTAVVEEAVENTAVAVVTDDPTEEPTAEATSEPTITPSATPRDTETPEAPDTATPVPSFTPTPEIVVRAELGRSTENRPIEVISVGQGTNHIVIIGALHGNEPGTQALVNDLAAYFEDNPDEVSINYRLHFIPGLNPDGLILNSRYTSTGVDINRNWDTPNWTTEAPQPDGTEDSGGPSPFSEPETAALHDFLGELMSNAQSIRTIIFHAHTGVPGTGRVQPGYAQPGSPVSQSRQLAEALIETGDYAYSATCCGSYTPTGEISNWLAINGIAAVDLELPSGGWPDQPIDGTTILQRAINNLLDLMG